MLAGAARGGTGSKGGEGPVRLSVIPDTTPYHICRQHEAAYQLVLKVTSTPKRPVDNVVITTKGLQDRNINILDGK